jgi:hypothetical protein
MKIADALTTTIIAAGTMLVALAVFWPTGLIGDDAGPRLQPIKVPQLEAAGAVLTLRSEKPSYAGGEDIELVLTAKNISDQPLEVRPEVSVLAQPPTTRDSRSLPVSRKVFEDQPMLTLKAGEEAPLTIDTKLPAKAGQTYSFVLAVGKEKIRVAGFTVAGAKAAGPLAVPATQPAAAARSTPARADALLTLP